MIKKIKNWGEGLGIYFTREEIGMYGLKEGDTIDLSDMFLLEAKYKQKSKK